MNNGYPYPTRWCWWWPLVQRLWTVPGLAVLAGLAIWRFAYVEIITPAARIRGYVHAQTSLTIRFLRWSHTFEAY